MKEAIDGSQDSKEVNCKLRPEVGNDENYKKEDVKSKKTISRLLFDSWSTSALS